MDKRHNATRKLSDIISDYMRENNLNRAMLEHRAQSLWQTVLGPTINSMTNEVSVRNNIMYVSMTSSVARHELVMMKSRIINKINEAVGEEIVKDIVFR